MKFDTRIYVAVREYLFNEFKRIGLETPSIKSESDMTSVRNVIDMHSMHSRGSRVTDNTPSKQESVVVAVSEPHNVNNDNNNIVNTNNYRRNGVDIVKNYSARLSDVLLFLMLFCLFFRFVVCIFSFSICFVLFSFFSFVCHSSRQKWFEQNKTRMSGQNGKHWYCDRI